MNRGPSVPVLIVIAGVGAAIVFLLATGGAEPTTDDPHGDVEVSDGGRPPQETGPADIVSASATVDEGRVVFAARMADDVPRSLEDGTLTWTWEVAESEQVTWKVVGSVDIEAHASLIATQFDYFAATVDGSLPGRIEIDGSEVRVIVESKGIARFPESFAWSVSSKLDGDRSKAISAVGEDRAPDDGLIDASS